MRRIDAYLRSMERFSAKAVVLTSGGHVLLRFPTGDRHATQTTTHDQLYSLIAEIAPDPNRALLDGGYETQFEYSLEGRDYTIAIDPAPNRWTVIVEPMSRVDDDMMMSVDEPAPARAAPGRGRAAPLTMPPERPEPQLRDEPQLRREPQLRNESRPAPISVPPPMISAAGRPFLEQLLIQMKQLGCSDLHLSSGSPPYVRLHGQLRPLEGHDKLSAEMLLDRLMEITPQINQDEFATRNDSDFAYNIEGVSRFRGNLFRDRNGPAAVFRAIPFEIPDATKLGLSNPVMDLCNLSKGLVLVTGPTGSGKSTTLAALIDHINRSRTDHIITIEDPIEFVHHNKGCLVNQREVHSHTRSFKDALRAALREDPDIVLVGEMRDLETIEIAVETAETGHLVFGTLHTTTAPSTVDRIIDQFPADRQEQIRQMLAKSLKGVIAQVLCRRKAGGRVAAYEVLLGTSAVENLIRERKTFQLFSVMQTGRNVGMQTMEDSLMELVKSGQVEADEAYRKAINKSEFKNQLGRLGINL